MFRAVPPGEWVPEGIPLERAQVDRREHLHRIRIDGQPGIIRGDET